MEVAESGVIELPPPPDKVKAYVPQEPDPRVEQARALILSTYLGIHDKNFYEILGVSTEATQEEIAAAFGAQMSRFRLADYRDLDLGRDYAKLEEIHVILRRAFDVLSDPIQRLDYDRRIGLGGTLPETPSARGWRPDPVTAELRYKDGIRAFQARQYQEAAAHFVAATNLAPEVAEYHVHAALALHLAEGEAARDRVEAHLNQALSVDADHPLAHEIAGRVRFESGDEDGAIAHLEHALDVDPMRLEAFSLLEQIFTRRKDWRRLERQYRKMIHRVGDRDPSLQLRLWWNLAEIYRARIGDLESARVAFETACRLSPDEPLLYQSLAEVTASRPELWQETAWALRMWWRLRPEDPLPGRSLFALHYGAGRWDAALVAAMALVCRRDDGSPAALEFVEHARPTSVPVLPPLDADVLAKLRHPDDDVLIGELFGTLESVALQVLGAALEDLGVGPQDLVLPEQMPEMFGRVLGYACSLLGVRMPKVYRRADFGEEVHLAATKIPVLLVGTDVLLDQDIGTLTFKLCRAVSYLLPGRAVGGAFPARVLKTILFGAMTFAVSGLAVEDPEGHVARIRAGIASLPEEQQASVRELVGGLGQQRTSINLSRWSRALGRTADRVGLLACNDLLTAVRALGSAPGVDDLIDFALSDEYLGLRHHFGLAVRQ